MLIENNNNQTKYIEIIDLINKYYSFYNLRDYANELKKLCHATDCEHFTECPENHEKCKKRLNIKTSLIWELNESITSLDRLTKDFAKKLNSNNLKYPYTRIIYLKKYTDNILELNDLMNYHPKRYIPPRLYKFHGYLILYVENLSDALTIYLYGELAKMKLNNDEAKLFLDLIEFYFANDKNTPTNTNIDDVSLLKLQSRLRKKIAK